MGSEIKLPVNPLQIHEWEVTYLHAPTGDWRWYEPGRMSFRDAVLEALRIEGLEGFENCRLIGVMKKRSSEGVGFS